MFRSYFIMKWSIHLFSIEKTSYLLDGESYLQSKVLKWFSFHQDCCCRCRCRWALKIWREGMIGIISIRTKTILSNYIIKQGWGWGWVSNRRTPRSRFRWNCTSSSGGFHKSACWREFHRKIQFWMSRRPPKIKGGGRLRAKIAPPWNVTDGHPNLLSWTCCI